MQESHYYPFGLRMAGLSTVQSSDENKFLYNGKELEDEFALNWYNYGARFYDPQLVRWMDVDPADEFFSPYVFCGNNPIMFIDPDGCRVEAFTDLSEDDPRLYAYVAILETDAGQELIGNFQDGGPYSENLLELSFENMWTSGSASFGYYDDKGDFVCTDKVPGDQETVHKIGLKLTKEPTTVKNAHDFIELIDTIVHEIQHAVDDAENGYPAGFVEGDENISSKHYTDQRWNLLMDIRDRWNLDFSDEFLLNTARGFNNFSEDVYNGGQ